MNDEACQTVIIKLPPHSAVYDVLAEIQQTYKPLHTYLSIVLCIFGALTNFCNIVVLTRRQMRTPVNTILTAMACCDTVVLFSNLIYTTHYSFVAFKDCKPQHWSYGWALFLIAHAHLSLVGHSSSVWLSVMLALIRYLTLRGRGQAGAHIQIGLSHSHAAIALVICSVVVMNAPNFLTYKISVRELKDVCMSNTTVPLPGEKAFLPDIAEIARENHCIVFRLAFWISGTLFKCVPCILLSILVGLLLRILQEVKASHARLLKTSQHGRQLSSTNGTNSIAPRSSVATPTINRSSSIRATTRGERTDRTTHMLLAIVAVLLVTELPQGIMTVLSGVFSEEFRHHVYNNLGDILDLLSLCGACASFIIYCSMSGQFRNEFRRVFVPHTLTAFLEGRKGRRASDTMAYTKLTLIRPSDLQNTSEMDRSVAITQMVGSGSTVRRDASPLLTAPSTPVTPAMLKAHDDMDTLISDGKRNGGSPPKGF